MAEILKDGLTFQKLAEYAREFHGGCMEGLPENNVELADMVIEAQGGQPVYWYDPDTKTYTVYCQASQG